MSPEGIARGGGCVVWLTGLPSSGKSTLAARAKAALDARALPAVLLDGDQVRAALVPPPGYDPAGRAAFYETLARLAALIAAQGAIVLVPATAHARALRERARALAPRFVEVFVDVPLAECRRRDAKGLYRAGASGLPGGDLPYEPPLRPDVIARGGEDAAALAALLARLAAG